MKSEIERIWQKGKVVLFDVDVKGGINLKNIFKQKAISVFISPPDLNTLEHRLKLRGTESSDSLKQRIEKASCEMTFKNYFDYIVVNDVLNEAKNEITKIISTLINI